ncbi:hypothetical protein [Salinispora arenicola]|uniref:hypothetical protein n=1 Tax=Salinispora arenicola TaxID=168697 RepID=UPI00207A20DD|nr:hypothetical protein [Salinispora arenicola]MCN0180779.1 hypothetical protein [Salinispora arenicola]
MSDHLAGDSQRPVTGAGILVSRFLISGDRRHAVLLLLHPYSARMLISQVWVLAMRRSFASDESERRVFEYLNGVVARAGKPVPAQRIVEIIGLSLENSPTASRSAKRHVLPVLSDFIRREFQGDEQRAELVRAAEIRIDRRGRKDRMWSLRRRRAGLVSTTGLNSLVGQILKAQSAYSRELLEALPDEESGSAAVEVVGRVVAAVLKERFPQPPSPELISKFAAKVAKSSGDVRLDKLLTEAVVRDVLARADGVIDAPDDLVLHAKVMAFVQAVEDLGMYPWEVDRVINVAERAAEDAGVHLTKRFDH